jgi:hypothetical protein
MNVAELFPDPVADQVGQLIRGRRWITTDELLDALDEAHVWPEDFLRHATRRVKKALIRRYARRAVDEGGWPLAGSVVRDNPRTGRRERVYKQEAFFTEEDYRQQVAYWERQVRHAEARRDGYADHCEARYGRRPIP